ncbi:MAG: AmmeMemoRadiSam system protein B [Candidatus Uhrbacteria bacterium]
MVFLVVQTVVGRSRVSFGVSPPHREEGSGAVDSSVSKSHAAYPITGILGINDVINAVAAGITPNPSLNEGGETQMSETSDSSTISAAILPHHTMTGPQLFGFWTELSTHSNPSVIVIVGPNHPNLGIAQVQTTHGDWPTPFGTVRTDDTLVDKLIATGSATDEPLSFVNEHSIGTHVSYVAKLFPGVPIVPVIAKSTADEGEARSFERSLASVLPPDALIVFSIDFCHYLPADKTAQMDAETISFVDARQYYRIQALHSDHLDSPFSLMTYLLWNDFSGNDSTLVWHSSSHAIQGTPDAPGTSYFVYESTRPLPPKPPPTYEERKQDPPTDLTAVGDIMLGRSVATALAKTTVESAFSSARSVVNGSGIVFGNLESVLTSSDHDTGKSIHFKGDPARVDVLHYLGFTDLSVANNHVDDYGKAGWSESVQILKDSGFRPVGDYNDHPVPTVGLPSDPQASDSATLASGSPGDPTIVFLAYQDLYHPLDNAQIAADIASAKKLGDVVAVSFHWGVEYNHDHTARQTELAHLAIDAGATLVIGSHPHVLEGIEKYKDGLILYSLGNFVFDQVGEDQNESIVVKFHWNADGTRAFELVPMRIVGTFSREATAAESVWTIGRIASWSPDPTFVHAGEIAW